ncbi:hypothetical protein F383_06990 [Gossypium arboreum]|uniref:Uncharacterized protein n=1 Tax=Gossypium arboreum TaxID=29729 RepID=A0A0B0PGD5_GOSAR|nr:hypothetical protein F383_06990 [Gossypium arboreum]
MIYRSVFVSNMYIEQKMHKDQDDMEGGSSDSLSTILVVYPHISSSLSANKGGFSTMRCLGMDEF